MGEVYHGIPPDLAMKLVNKYELSNFVETGTLIGRTAEWASSRFKNVYTVEISLNYYQMAKAKLDDLSNVQLVFGKSQDVLYDLVPMLQAPTLFWLDAHWSRDLGYPRLSASICPVLEEIACIGQASNGHVILVDDFRLFGQEKDWPTKDEVKRALEGIGKKVTFSADVFIAVPNEKE